MNERKKEVGEFIYLMGVYLFRPSPHSKLAMYQGIMLIST